ncbi:Z1 domain-containing protein [Dietzia cinnamea]|uniref:Z1 domain-containing protein n=1 Tax=Dietzia cinnamea TaxID=321318 RepID=A0A4R3ZQD3_9ACTN|nr:Z1 domain-containing protein [Dietzia cinnamea]TCW21178.1 Z1 domain-containing protein [Dietzia cinnamea]
MDPAFIRETLIGRMRRHGEDLEAAMRSTARGLGVDISTLKPAADAIRREGARNRLLTEPAGVVKDLVRDELTHESWYTGEEEGDEFWPRLRAKMQLGSLSEALPEIDKASTKVVALCADPNVRRLKKRGMVVGHVQSGKTANYTAVMAKAADAGYQLFIVLAGMHNNLRRQTQVRLTKDLLDDSWAPLTTRDDDFGTVTNGSAMLKNGTKAIAVVKKNQSRLESLRTWLSEIPEDIRARVPVMILDDEADQATPNSSTNADSKTRINELVREIWAEVKTGTYVGYTATPFANVFMDPHDEEELYPADFIVDLPRPKAYFGAERLFGREPLDEEDTPSDGMDVIRYVPDEDADQLRPPSGAENRNRFDPELPPSLIEAISWFIVSTAIRHARGEAAEHSSMLIHTTHFVGPHFAMKERVDAHLQMRLRELAEGRSEVFHESFEREAARASDSATKPMPPWETVQEHLCSVAESVRVIVDNGFSRDRLDYEREDDDGEKLTETVIAIGGGTLSRGLTLEGLVVSYFVRTSNTYDTLLQMGRWFGFRPGYEDLPRIWMPRSLALEFQFLALIEEEIRQDMRRLEKMQVTPKEMGIRVRSHPGRLAIVAKNKMQHADIVWVSFSGKRLQTFIFDEFDASIQRQNIEAARKLIAEASNSSAAGVRQISGSPKWVAHDLPAATVIRFLNSYRIHPDQSSMRADHLIGWIETAASDRRWNLVIKGSAQQQTLDGTVIDLGSIDLGLPVEVPAVNRAPLTSSSKGVANIKSLLSQSDWYADLDPTLIADRKALDYTAARELRRDHANGNGLIIIYPVSKHSVPLSPAQLRTNSRRAMTSPEHLIGVGIILPDIGNDGVAEEGDYYSVTPDWEMTADSDETPPDLEGSAQFDGADRQRA